MNLHSKTLPKAIASLVVAGTLVGSVLLLAMTSAKGATETSLASPATATPGPTEVAPTATPSATPIATPIATPSATASATPSASPTSRPAPSVRESLVADGTEPSIAADPFHPGVVAVLSENLVMMSLNSGCSRPAVRISRDGGLTWGPAVYPWRGQCQDVHAVIAWGPGSRLWAGDAVGASGGVAMSVTHSDDLGKTWSAPFVQHFTPGWSGCFPAMTVDDWPGSPNFGTVYVAYNWLPDAYGPGVAVMASRNGDSWVHTEVSLDSVPGYPYSWRIGYRIAAAPNGTAFVSFYESNLKTWDPDNMLNEGPETNIGRIGFEVARVHYDGQSLSADAPSWVTSVDRTEAQWQSGLAVDDSGRAWLAVESEGRIGLGRLDGGWRQFSVTGQSSFKASLAISGRIIFVGWHASDDAGFVRTYYTLSYDSGETFLPPALISDASWHPRSADVINGVGLRENADFQNGVVYYAYGDARSGLGVYMAQITP